MIDLIKFKVSDKLSFSCFEFEINKRKKINKFCFEIHYKLIWIKFSHLNQVYLGQSERFTKNIIENQ